MNSVSKNNLLFLSLIGLFLTSWNVSAGEKNYQCSSGKIVTIDVEKIDQLSKEVKNSNLFDLEAREKLSAGTAEINGESVLAVKTYVTLLASGAKSAYTLGANIEDYKSFGLHYPNTLVLHIFKNDKFECIESSNN
jgi:hypothetical protein